MVVPYNANLLKLFKCHINVELSSSVRLIRYLYKSFYKGCDYTKGKVEHDEIREFTDGRYLSASEAAYRFFEFEMTRREPGVKCYPIHLEMKQLMIYKRGEEEQALNHVSLWDSYFNDLKELNSRNLHI